ncbi:MAG: chromosome segregation protein SMC, partial [Lachnospiraceae bacterium]|nr:chromosome segregation protein SMC [Lachnospiraceae bacterium]
MLPFNNPDYEYFFNPLCCKNKKIYYECIMRLIEKSKAVSVLYEPDARDFLILYLRNCAYPLEDEDNTGNAEEGISSKKTEAENANAILRYFRRCGWIAEREIGRNGDNIASVTPYCRRLIDAIERIFNRDAGGALTNHIFAMYDTLRSALHADHGRTSRPYTSILQPLSGNVSDLKSELLALKDSIRFMMRAVIKMTEINTFGQFLMRDEMLKLFFDDYFFIKKDGLIPGYIAEIERMLRRILNTELYESMIREYQDRHQIDERGAREAVEGQFAEIQSFIEYDYGKEIDYIDKKINSYYSLYSTRILMVLSSGTNLQNYLNDLLMMLRDFDEEERREAIAAISESFQLQSCKYVGRKSIERRKKRRPDQRRGAVAASGLSEEERARLTRELLYEYPDRYGVAQAAAYFDGWLKGRAETGLG